MSSFLSQARRCAAVWDCPHVKFFFLAQLCPCMLLVMSIQKASAIFFALQHLWWSSVDAAWYCMIESIGLISMCSTGYDDEDHALNEEDGQDAYAQGVGSQAEGFFDPLQFEPDAVVSETQYSQPQPIFMTPNPSMSGFRAVGGYYSTLGNDSYSGQQACVGQRPGIHGLNLNSHYFFK